MSSMQGNFSEQIMVDLPKVRVNEAPPFTHCDVDLLGPSLVKERGIELKRYGAFFSCLDSKAVHIEVVATIETDLLIMALQKMIARKGNIRSMRSDNGTKFVGTDNELKRVF